MKSFKQFIRESKTSNLEKLYNIVILDDEVMEYIEDEYGFSWNPNEDRENPTLQEFLEDNSASSEISEKESLKILKIFKQN